jgi:glycosyltransferase involved in cell wall biosynthesis
LRLLATVTFNPNQLRAHLEPILRVPEVRSVTLVADAPAPAMPKLRTVVPPRLLVRVLGRAGAKFVTCVVISRRERPQWILAFNLVPHGITAALAARLVQARTVYHMIGGSVEWEGGGWKSDNRVLGRLPRPSHLLERLLLCVVRSCSIVGVMGEGGRRSLVERGIAAERVVVLPASIDLERFHPRPDARLVYDVITVGSLIPTKRVSDFLAAVARIRAHRPDLRAAVVGVGPLEHSLRAEAASLEIDGAVDFLGFQEEIETLYAQSAVFVLSSRYEGLSIATAEAMACGLPVVVSDVGEMSTLVRNGETGYRFPVGDVGALVSAVSTLLDDDAHRRMIGLAAAEHVRSLLSVERMSELYRSLLVDGVTGSRLPHGA